MNKYMILTLGCKVNSYESQGMKEILDQHGYSEDKLNPDLIIINTCAVTHVAEHKSKQKVSSFCKKFPNACIVACGCSTQLHKERYESLPNLAILMGNNNHNEIIELLNKYFQEKVLQVAVDQNPRIRKYQNLAISNFDEKSRAYVKIGDGCNNFCTYCIIPYNRGNLRSRNKDDILQEVQRLIQNNYQEIIVTGIDSASYGFEFENYRFNDLLEDIVKLPNLHRLRISSIEASQIDDRFIQIIAKYPNIMPHFTIPLQSGSNTVLKRMNRHYNCQQFLEKIRLIQDKLPYVALSGDVIVGFPGETDEEFEETYNFIKECKFSFLHVFPYSLRSGTVAAKMDNQISEEVKKQRMHRLLDLSKEQTAKFAASLVNQEISVLIESYDKQTHLFKGLSGNYLEVYVKSEENLLNQIITLTYLGQNHQIYEFPCKK